VILGCGHVLQGECPGPLLDTVEAFPEDLP
jgi:hypothetical protein